MTPEEELQQLRREKSQWQEQLAQRDEQIAQMQHELKRLGEEVQALQEEFTKDRHNSHPPPCSDRFHRQPTSLRKSSGKKPGGQSGHAGNTLLLSQTPDLVMRHTVEQCQHCQQDLREVGSAQVERRQVIDLPPKRLVITEHQAECKVCPVCQQVTQADFPDEVRAPVQYGAAFGAIGVYLVQQQLLPYERACEVMQERPGSDDERGHTATPAPPRCSASLPGRSADQSRPHAGGGAAPG